MKILFLSLFFLFSPLLADSTPAFPPNPFETEGGRRAPAFSEANAQAIYWINLIDQFQFGATWLEASGLVRDVTTQEQWAAAMQQTRQGLGPVTSRRVASHTTVEVLPNGTRGNFMIIHYDTNYSQRPNMVETITLMTEGMLSQWKVVAYRIARR